MRPDKTLALLHAQRMDGFFSQAFCREKLKGIVWQADIDRAHLGNHVRGYHFDDAVQLRLGL